MIKYIREQSFLTIFIFQLILLIITIISHVLNIRSMLFPLEVLLITISCVQFTKQFHDYEKMDKFLINRYYNIIYTLVIIFSLEHITNFIVNKVGYLPIPFEFFTIYFVLIISMSVLSYSMTFNIFKQNKNIAEKIKYKFEMFLSNTNMEKIDILYDLGYNKKLKDFYKNKKLHLLVKEYKKAEKMSDKKEILSDDYNIIYYSLKDCFMFEFDKVHDLIGVSGKKDKDKLDFMSDWINNI